MFISVHAAAATIIGKEIGNPALAFMAGFALHFILDIIPHGDGDFCKRVFGFQTHKMSEEEKFKSMAIYNLLDDIVLVFFLLFLFKNFAWAKDDNVIWAIIGGVIPDLLVALYMLTKSKLLKGFYLFHHNNHMLLIEKLKYDLPLKTGIVMQGAIFAVLIFIITLI